jgi:hypothetical protein
MKRHVCYLPVFTVVLMFIIGFFPSRLLAQKEVEIEVAGPWGYVTDPDNPERVVVIAPRSRDHEFGIFSGGNVPNYTSVNTIKPSFGLYKLDVAGFDPKTCSKPAPPPTLYSVAVSAQTVKAALSATGNRYAISLPKPCSYESYVEARTKIDTSSITSTTQEKSYTTWMILHFTVPSTSQQAVLNGSSDDGSTRYNNQPVGFIANVPSGAMAVSMVLYNTGGSEDYLCDAHSAEFFDQAANDLWGQRTLARIFPEIYDVGAPLAGEQTHRYNYTRCAQSMSSHAMKEAPLPSDSFIASISAIRENLARSDFEQAKSRITALDKSMKLYWHDQVPKVIQDDLDGAAKVIDKGAECKKCKILGGNQLMRLTMYLFAPGRTDCHAPQFDVNNTVVSVVP